jgi:ribonucleoside-triphosphate reductase
MFEHIKKLDRRMVSFDPSRISTAIAKAGSATGEFGGAEAEILSVKVLGLARKLNSGTIHDVEGIQDVVEMVLRESKYHKSARAYILYREKRAKIRDMSAKANVRLVENHLDRLDWKVRETSNMPKSYLTSYKITVSHLKMVTILSKHDPDN